MAMPKIAAAEIRLANDAFRSVSDGQIRPFPNHIAKYTVAAKNPTAILIRSPDFKGKY